MDSIYTFSVSVQTPSGEYYCARFPVEAWMRQELRPYDRCSDSFTAALWGGVTAERALRIDEDGKALAREIAENLTEHLLQAMKARDLNNGYAK